jgi:hypothetical protein
MTRRTELIDTLDRLLDPLAEEDPPAPPNVPGEVLPSEPSVRNLEARVLVPLSSEEAAAGTRQFVRFTVEERCARCGGTGRRRKGECRRCKGSGVEDVERRLRVQIQPGVKSGTKLVVPEAGSMSPVTERRGDLIVEIRVE